MQQDCCEQMHKCRVAFITPLQCIFGVGLLSGTAKGLCRLELCEQNVLTKRTAFTAIHSKELLCLCHHLGPFLQALNFFGMRPSLFYEHMMCNW